MQNRLSKAAKMAAGILILAVLPLILPLVSTCVAQPAIVPDKSPKSQNGVILDAKKQHFIGLRHVSASLMARWLDPKNNSALLESPTFGGEFFNSMPAPVFVLPTGVDRIIALERQKTLLVFGTDAGAKQLEEIVAFLDRPIRELEIEAQIIEISSANLGGIWANLASQLQLQKPAMGLSNQSDQTLLSENFARKEANLLSLQTQKFVNNETQTLDFSPAAPDVFISPQLTIPGRPPGDFWSPMPVIPPPRGMAEMPGMFGQIMPRKSAAPQPYESSRLQITPTLNADGSVTLLVEGAGLAPRDLQSIAGVPAGQSLVFALPVFNFEFSKRAFLILTPRATLKIPLR